MVLVGWRSYDLPAGSDPEQLKVITLTIPKSKITRLIFIQNKWQGIASIQTGKKSRLIDCFGDCDGNNFVFVDVKHNGKISQITSSMVILRTFVSSKKASVRCIDFSIDDTIEIFKHISEMNYESPFDEPLLHYLRDLHNRTGMSITLYCFYEDDCFNLSMCTRKFKDEFEDNSEWLKFGFHARNVNSEYVSIHKEKLYADYILCMENLEQICGKKTLTGALRLHGFKGTKNEIKKMVTNVQYPLKLLFCSDDKRNSYCLNNRENILVQNGEPVHDAETGCKYVRTDIRVEKKYSFLKFLKYKRSIFTGRTVNILTHEWFLNTDDGKVRLESVLAKLL